MRYGWLGSKQRSADDLGGLVLMGVRLYVPATGRFLQTDPVPGGSANAYDYVNQDPLNAFDLDGRMREATRYDCDSRCEARYRRAVALHLYKPQAPPKAAKARKCSRWNPVCQARRHWRVLAQVLITAVAIAGAGVCARQWVKSDLERMDSQFARYLIRHPLRMVLLCIAIGAAFLLASAMAREVFLSRTWPNSLLQYAIIVPGALISFRLFVYRQYLRSKESERSRGGS